MRSDLQLSIPRSQTLKPSDWPGVNAKRILRRLYRVQTDESEQRSG
jgi:hypothetical protein